MQVRGGDTIHVTYTDAIDAQGRPNTPHAFAIPVRAGTDGVLTVPASIRSDQGLAITVTDADRNVNPAGRDFVTPDDVKAVAVPALSHRLMLRPELWVQRVRPEDVVQEVLDTVPTPAAEDLTAQQG